ncbi:MAG: hypothetical protein UW46_C0001G0016 [Candidatus Yanofskybacteria bacterium GW2011_GWF1_44_227]|uniref:Uncharacterized protein n=1 Tax=Candidatus Yanofskybacteria bacterium GW2011_GWE2_40_11 TaxID=1619033 RepID=A0A0G0T161_9BACT|nr:MAG: hypothetical protein UT69_C0012G0034 [Candidatus Yanofskybacteria bacterium GW2011_GWE1_40_10]KKR40845.1 MAG: hypothetical protein UT75_C0004G0056 [Candidatus Yanofskybacteria bacterium GW2011_GWE2_40_11]KKT15960.1 MAG: hypothetical protein UV97_C0001G0133 [Candidatus Yanofskybacteria bacterium GW2011_GWF2_43_596]KKT53526.1 MAG: hypothetical protein UW46_C0001G0016 [Candidatus Yanofskybacteria bacterium GW2011_GWF1_44_227]OGN36050.1 MAG: hypothetical protein A2207_03260 [Candidatus Yano
MPVETMILFLLAGLLGYLVFKFGNVDDPLPYLVGVVAVIFLLTGIDSCRAYFRNDAETIAAEHAGHEALHTQIENDLLGAEPGDILESSGARRMFVVQRQTPATIGIRPIFDGSELQETPRLSALILAHTKVIKFGTPEHAAALEAEAADKFSYYHGKPR